MGALGKGIGTLAILAAATGAGCSEEAGQQSARPGGPARPAPSAPAPKPETPAAPVTEAPAEAPEERSHAELVAAGRSAYNANCIACHSMDPTQDGALGPAVAGASPELLEARILRAEYPEGYAPKRPSRVMVALPHLEPRLPELAAYLASLAPDA